MFAGENLLAIDTSTEQAGIAVLAGERSVELRWTSGREQTTSVLDQVDRCLSLVNVAASDLHAIAVASGPGMFNGLRVGMSMAKGFALSLDVPIVGVSTLEVTAFPWLRLGSSEGIDVVPVVSAGRGRVVFTRYSAGEGPGGEPENATIDELFERIRAAGGRQIVVGELPDDRLAELADTGCIIDAGSSYARSPMALARLGVARLRAGEQDDLVALEPVYVHGRRAVTQR